MENIWSAVTSHTFQGRNIMDSAKYFLWLNSLQDIGPVLAKRLIEQFRTPQAIFNANDKQLMKVEGIGEYHAKVILENRNLSFDKEIEKLEKQNVYILPINHPDYPFYLKNIYAPPTILYVKGEMVSKDKAIAIVGSRNASSYGMRAAYDFARELARKGITVVSGMARGIDTAAHKGALDGGGRTIAVLGCGLDYIYPPENKELMGKIINNGAVISEYPLGTIPDSKNFPNRNRIISGLSLGTVIVEANIKSGSLITADFAAEQGREVFAVPGQIYSKTSQGTNDLIKQGAKAITKVEDILEEFKIDISKDKANQDKEIENNNLNNEEKVIWESISNEPMHLENIMKLSGFSIGKLNTVITLLELKGLIRQLPGKQFVRN